MRTLLVVWLLSLLLVGGCGSATLATPEPVTLTIAGSTEAMPVLMELTTAFSQRHPHVFFSLRGGGSSLGEAWVVDRRVDLAASSLLYDDSELAPGVTRVPIALDGVAILLHDSNPIDQLTLLQLRDLYSGRILDWSEVGGQSGEVLLVSREDGSGTRRLFEERTMGDERVALTAVVMPTSKDMVAYVASHPQAIGYVSQAYTALNHPHTQGPATDDGADVKVVAVEGILPTRTAIAEQRYPLVRPLFLLRRLANRGWSQQFIDFALSPAGQTIVDQFHVRIR